MMFSIEQNHWFIRKVICWRAAASIAWSVLLLPLTAAVFAFLGRFSLFHPFQWISETLTLLYGSSAIFSLVLLCGVVMVVGLFNLEYYTVVPSIPCTRVALLGKVLHPQQVAHSLVHCMMGMLVAWCAATIIGGRYQVLVTPCPDGEGVTGHPACLNEHHLFFLLAGAFMGYSYSLLGVVRNVNYVSFPIIRQYKYLHFKSTLSQVVKFSAVQALYLVRNYCVLYFFLGYIPRAWICVTLSLHRDKSLHGLDTFGGLLDLSLLYHLWISGAFLLTSWHITLQLFRIFITEFYINIVGMIFPYLIRNKPSLLLEAYTFPVQSSFSEEAEQCLPKTISVKQPLVLKFLALQDLALLSDHSPTRRLEVFSLSQPGGHPHSWNAISTECLSLLAELTQRLVSYQEAVASNGRTKVTSSSSEHKSSSESSVMSSSEDPTQAPRHTVGLKTPGSVFMRSSVAGLRTPLSGTVATPFTPPVTPDLDSPFSPAARKLVGSLDSLSPWYGSVQSPHVMRRGPKLWSSSAGSSLPESPVATLTAPSTKEKPSFLSLWLQNRQEQVKSFLAKRVLVMYLFSKLPEASSQALFADSQAHIWALEGLSHLVAASYSEDRYGVVQTTLPSILSTLLLLQEAVDRHFKLPHASSKPVRSTCCLEDSTFKTLRFALRAALKTALYRISSTFGQHLNAVQMSAEHRKRLQQFMEYKE